LPNPTPKDELRPGGRNNHSRTQNPTANTGQFIAETLPHRKKKCLAEGREENKSVFPQPVQPDTFSAIYGTAEGMP
jgi:hypothetical protein